MAADAQGWPALRDGLGPGWFFVAAAAVAGFWTVHEPGASWTTMLAGRSAGFVLLALLSTLWFADWAVQGILDGATYWLRQAFVYGWAVLLVLAAPLAWGRALLEPGPSVALAAAHLWLSGLGLVAAALLWYHDDPPKDRGRRFYLATAATGAAVGVWSLQLGIFGWMAADEGAAWVAWPVAATALLAFLLCARLAGVSLAPPRRPAPHDNP